MYYSRRGPYFFDIRDFAYYLNDYIERGYADKESRIDAVPIERSLEDTSNSLRSFLTSRISGASRWVQSLRNAGGGVGGGSGTTGGSGFGGSGSGGPGGSGVQTMRIDQCFDGQSWFGPHDIPCIFCTLGAFWASNFSSNRTNTTLVDICSGVRGLVFLHLPLILCPLIFLHIRQSVFMLYNLLSVDFGPFNPLMGCIFALGAVAYAIRRSFLGRKQIWQTEHNALPQTVNKMGTVASIAGIVLIYVSATPDRMHDMMGWLIWFAILAILSYLLYYFLANVCSCTMVTGANGQDPVIRKILCGLWLTPEGRKAKREHANVKRERSFVWFGR